MSSYFQCIVIRSFGLSYTAVPHVCITAVSYERFGVSPSESQRDLDRRRDFDRWRVFDRWRAFDTVRTGGKGGGVLIGGGFLIGGEGF